MRVCFRNKFERKVPRRLKFKRERDIGNSKYISIGTFEDAWRPEGSNALHASNVADSDSKTVMVEVV